MDNQNEPTHKINWGDVIRRSFEMGPIRPPSEGKDSSLLIRATRNCPWNRCLFCSTYKDSRFEYRPVAEIKEDIDVARVLHDEIKAASWKSGLSGRVSNELIRAIVQANPEIYLDNGDLPLQNLANIANWTASGARTLFLQDADTLIMRTPELLQIIRYLEETFPTIERITSYARAKAASKKTLQELKDLHEAGLSRLHIGLESGNDEVLAFMQKGVNQEQHISGGQKVVAAGISLSEYIMPGLGGKRWSQAHALDSARALSAINPDFIRLRSLIVRRNSILYDKYLAGEFEPLSEDEFVDEIALFIENL
ncbi:MAG: radical SAM protein, partial [Dehalococcoidales bacterium]|nr:radical SAM protein [Dehalococcoidales bacterium]